MKRRLNIKSFVFVLLSLVWALCAEGVAAAQPVRLKGWIGTGRTVSMPGSSHPMARPEFDRGLLNADRKLTLVMGLKKLPEQQADLDQFLVELQDPQSPQFHQWLTPEEYADRFGVSATDIDKIKAWLESEGFTVVDVARARNYVRFAGTAGTTQKAFGAEIHRYVGGAEEHFANAGPISIPADLSGMVTGVRGLHDFLPKTRHGRGVRNPGVTSAAHRPRGIADLRGSHPHAMDSDGNPFLLPADLATIYDVNPVYTHGWDGAGQRIAIAGGSELDVTDIESFREQTDLRFNNPQTILVPGFGDPGMNDSVGEADLDIEWAGAVAPGAKIIYVYSTDPFIAALWAIDQAIAPVLSASFGICEWHLVPDDFEFFRNFSQEGAALGITWVVSSGDSGAAGCENQNGAWTISTTPLSVSMPSSLPEVTAVGGTEFNEGDRSYWSFSSGPNFGTAVSYIPEVVWNDERALLQASQGPPEFSTLGLGFAAGGGGASIYFSKPAWQAGPGVPRDGARDVPDISFTASGAHDPYIIISGGEASPTGGTSASTPVFAGVLALLNQYLVGTKAQAHAGLGNINPLLYFFGQNAPNIYHDITAGSNAVPCMPRSSRDCPASGVYGYSAGPGYDLATGWGSVDVTRLIVTWASLVSSSSKTSATQPNFRTPTGTGADSAPDALLEHRRGPENSGWPVMRH